MESPDHTQYLNLGDIHSATPPSHSSSTFEDSDLLNCTPPPVIIQSRPAKKRKSWGQQLPEPKTTLPPRKRAKTDDEKEQRRIERIKRNRAAAHNSRERKRQETETLAVALARANAELEAYRKLHGPLPASVVLPEVTLCTESADTPAPSLSESRGSIDDGALSPASPHDSLFQMTDCPTIKEEPVDSSNSLPLTPTFANLDMKLSSAAYEQLDPTQHSAAMLCDLQCRSTCLSSTHSSGRSPALSISAASWTNLFLFLMTTQLQDCYRTLMVALWAISPSRMARLMQASAARSSRSRTSSTTPQLSRSTPRRLALSSAATGLRAPAQGGALALQRQSFISALNAGSVQQAGQDQANQSCTAFTEHGGKDRSTGDLGDQNQSVSGNGSD